MRKLFPCHDVIIISLIFGILKTRITRWRHQMEAFSALLVLCAGNSPITGEFPSQRPVTRTFDVFFDLRLSKRLSKQSWGWWFETPSCSLWRHCKTRIKLSPFPTPFERPVIYAQHLLMLFSLTTHWGWGNMAAIFQTAFLDAFCPMKMYNFRLRFCWSLFPRVQLTIFQHWYR